MGFEQVLNETRFPNLFIIGAMKAGTSSLHEYLHQHPEIFMARMKEPQYFAPHTTRQGLKWGQGNPHPEPGIDWYLKLFESGGDVRYAGESSVSYTARPWVSGCEQRIFDFNPDARLIYLMRDPIERAISHYWHFVADGREDRAMLPAIQRKEEYIARSDYALQLKPYLELFGAERVYTLTMEELTGDPATAFRQLFAWLGVDADYEVDVSRKYNVSPEELRQTRRRLVGADTLLKTWRWKKTEQVLPRAIPRVVRGLIYRRVDRRAIDAEPTIRYLRPILQRQTEALSRLLGRDFSEWKTLYPRVARRQAEPVSIAVSGSRA